MEIRTAKGKLFGTLDTDKYLLHIKDGRITRTIQIPRSGLTLEYMAGGGVPEKIRIPPMPARLGNRA